jgi:hypothetical protein
MSSRPTPVPGLKRHSIKLRTSAPGYIAERACREELFDLLSILLITHDNNPSVLTSHLYFCK